MRRPELGLRRRRADGADRGVLDVAPVLGLCYGMQLMAHLAGRRGDRAGEQREYGRAELTVHESGGSSTASPKGEKTPVWMSHGDHVDARAAGLRR